MTKDGKFECPKCHSSFDMPMYLIHLSEESLKQQIEIANGISKLAENFELFFSYMNEDSMVDNHDNDREDDASNSIIVASNINDSVITSSNNNSNNKSENAEIIKSSKIEINDILSNVLKQ